MLPIAGTIRNSVKLDALDQKWQQKKNHPGKKDGGKKVTAEERELQELQRQAAEIRESNKAAGIDAKLKAGAVLTPEEMKYLKEHAPETLRDYEESVQKRESYKRALKNCKNKEDVEQLRLNRLGNLSTQVKKISNNPNIPKSKKLELLKKLLKETAGLQAEYTEFTKSMEYQELPDQAETKRASAEEPAAVPADEADPKANPKENPEADPEPDAKTETVESQKAMEEPIDRNETAKDASVC